MTSQTNPRSKSFHLPILQYLSLLLYLLSQKNVQPGNLSQIYTELNLYKTMLLPQHASRNLLLRNVTSCSQLPSTDMTFSQLWILGVHIPLYPPVLSKNGKYPLFLLLAHSLSLPKILSYHA